MNERWTARWTLGLLLALLLGHLFLLSTSQHARGNRLEEVLLTTLGPIGHAVVATSDAVRGFFTSLRLAGTLRRENAGLEREVETLRRELARLQGVEEKLERLSSERGYTAPTTGELIVADVVYVDPRSWLRTLVLYTGTVEPRRNQPVIAAAGLVGRIVVPAGRYAKVLLLTDPSLAVSAMIERTRQRGLARGGGDGPLALENIPIQADVKVGDAVVTAGIDGVFPRGIPIGKVATVAPGDGLFQRIAVEPWVEPATLDQVYVLSQEAVPAEVKEALALPGEEDRHARH